MDLKKFFKNTQRNSDQEDRKFLAESLEARILYSGSPVPVDFDAPNHEFNLSTDQCRISFEPTELFDSQRLEPENQDDDSDTKLDQLVHLISLENLTDDALSMLADAAAQRWVSSGLSDEQIDALDRIEYEIVDLDASLLGMTDEYEVMIDLNGAGKGWFVDPSPFEDREFQLGVSSTLLRATQDDASIDLLSVLMHEQGHVLGLDHIDASNSVMYHTFDRGERRMVESGAAEGTIPGSLVGPRYVEGNPIALGNDFFLAPPIVLSISGSGEPTVFEVDDTITISITFSESVTLSGFGDASVNLDIGGTMVTAIHSGATSGTTLNFDATVPGGIIEDNDGIDVLENSLQLLNGATLISTNTSFPALVSHDAQNLSNDLVDNSQPDPVDNSQPDPVDNSQPDPVDNSQPDPVDNSQPDPVDNSQPDPVDNSQPDPVDNSQPDPVDNSQPDPVDNSQPDPVDNSQPDPVDNSQPDPVDNSQPDPVDNSQPDPVDSSQPDPVDNSQPDPVDNSQPDPVDNSQPDPVDFFTLEYLIGSQGLFRNFTGQDPFGTGSIAFTDTFFPVSQNEPGAFFLESIDLGMTAQNANDSFQIQVREIMDGRVIIGRLSGGQVEWVGESVSPQSDVSDLHVSHLQFQEVFSWLMKKST